MGSCAFIPDGSSLSTAPMRVPMTDLTFPPHERSCADPFSYRPQRRMPNLLLCTSSKRSLFVPYRLDGRIDLVQRYQCTGKVQRHCSRNSQYRTQRHPAGVVDRKLDQFHLLCDGPGLLVDIYPLHDPKVGRPVPRPRRCP